MTPSLPHKELPYAKGLLAAFLVGCLLLFFVGIGKVGLFDVDEAIFAQSSYEMLERDDFITPYYNEEPRYHKPPLIYWLQAGSMKIFGKEAFASRLPSAIFAFLTLLGFYVMLSGLTGNVRFALTASAIFGLNLSYLVIAQAATADMALNFFVLMATLTFLSNIYAVERSLVPIFVGSLFLALALLAKGPVALMVPCVVVGLAVLFRPGFCYNIKCVNPIFVLAFVFVVLFPWIYMVIADKGMDFFKEFWFTHNLGRYTEAMGNTQSGSPFYYVSVLLIGFFPWVLLLPAAAVWALKDFWARLRSDKIEEALPVLGLAWFLVVVVFFSFSATKLPHYILPAYAGAAILIAARLSALKKEPLSSINWLWVLPITFLFGLFFIIFKWVPSGMAGQGSETVNSIFSTLSTTFSFNWPVDDEKTLLILSQDVHISILPVMMGALVLAAFPLAFSVMMKGERRGITILVASMWMVLVLAVLSVVPAAYEYTQRPLANIAEKIRKEYKEGDVLVHLAIHQPSVRFISDIPFERAHIAADLTKFKKADGRLFVVLKQDRLTDSLNILKGQAHSYCEAGYCFIDYQN